MSIATCGKRSFSTCCPTPFTLEGGINIALRPSADRKAAELTVTDTGAGIPADHLPKLFERFYQVDGQKGRSIEGSGIGLALVKEVVRLHGGTITVESEPGRGSKFKATVPFGAAHLPPEQVRTGVSVGGENSKGTDGYVGEALRWLQEPARADQKGGQSSASGKMPRILIADDSADM
jgi:hypothetical protein